MTKPALLSIPASLIPSLKRRMEAKVVTSDDGCLEWAGFKTPEGYGITTITIDGKTRAIPAHRASWMVNKGAIPDGHVLDHLCRVRACVNVDHLEPIMPNENTFRGHASRKGVNSPARPAWIEPELWAEFQAATKAANTTASETVRQLIRDWTNTHKQRGTK